MRIPKKSIKWPLPNKNRLLAVFVKTRHIAWLLGFIPVAIGGWWGTFVPLFVINSSPVIAILGTTFLTIGYCGLYFWAIYSWVKRKVPVLSVTWTGFQDSPADHKEYHVRTLEGVPREFIKIWDGRRRAVVMGNARELMEAKRKELGLGEDARVDLTDEDLDANENWYPADINRLHKEEVPGVAEDDHPEETLQYALPDMLDPKASYDETLLVSPSYVRRRWKVPRVNLIKSKEEGLFWAATAALVLGGTFMLVFGDQILSSNVAVEMIPPPVTPPAP